MQQQAVVIAFALVAAVGQTGAQPILFSQPLDTVGVSSVRGGVISEGQSGGFFNERKADNFTPAATGPITDIRFWGFEEGFFSIGFPGNLDGVLVEIFDDNAGLPGSAIFSQNYSFGDLTVNDTGRTAAFGQAVQEFTAPVTTGPLFVTAGQQYWISVGGLSDTGFANEDSFVWAFTDDSLGDDLRAFENPVFSGFQSELAIDQDLAFELIGIPSPGAAGLLAVAAPLLTRRRR